MDTESNSLHAYREQVCLVQFSTPRKGLPCGSVGADPTLIAGARFCQPAYRKIFHAAEYDLVCLHRDFGFTFANLFDTMQAERILGYEKVGLDAAA